MDSTAIDTPDFADEALKRRGFWFDGVIGIAAAVCDESTKSEDGTPCQQCVAATNVALARLYGVAL